MPTGYTADVIEKDISFREFALKCTRAFGALVSFRDEDMNKVITEIPLDDHCQKSLKDAKDSLKTFRNAEPKTLEAEALRAINNNYTNSKHSRDQAIAENKKLNKMISQVKKWKPPTPEHDRYKEFMLKQLTISLCDLKYYEVKKPSTSKKAIAAWINSRRKELEKSVAYYEDSLAREVKNNSEANAWIKAIVDSLPKEVKK